MTALLSQRRLALLSRAAAAGNAQKRRVHLGTLTPRFLIHRVLCYISDQRPVALTITSKPNGEVEIAKDNYVYIPNPVIQPPRTDNAGVGNQYYASVQYNGERVSRFVRKAVKVPAESAMNPAASWEPRVSVTMDLALNPAAILPYESKWEQVGSDAPGFGWLSTSQRELGELISRIATSGTEVGKYVP